ncbi:hypothetical protein TA3x_001899 [Tundrisphaera sp. TA3]|uniref:hypothetical protein n=1 Tax=Tundrisphaera sp. TA3 TaxID=3435775 RepID=UPI003EC082FC
MRSLASAFVFVSLIVPANYAFSQEEPLKANKRDTVKDHRYMESNATLYRNGKFVIQTRSWSKKNFQGLKGQSVFAVVVDGKGNAIWASKVHKCKTIGGTQDPGTASDRKDTNDEKWPEAIGQHAKSIDIYHDAGDLSQNRKSQVNDIKEAVKSAGEIAQEVKNAIKKLE